MGLRVGVIVAASLVALSAFAEIPEIRNATPEQTKQIKAALEKIPACWRTCNGDPASPIKVVDANMPTQAGWDMWGDKDDLDGMLVVDQLALDSKESRAGANELADLYCSKRGGQMFSTRTEALTRAFVHEYGHKQHLSCGQDARDEIKKLADKRYFDKRTAVRNDPAYQPTQDAITQLLDEALANWKKANPNAPPPKNKAEQIARMNEGMTDAMRAKNCELRKKVSEIYVKNGMPVRFEGDTHAADTDKSDLEEDATEYFAMLIETALFDGAAFCKAASADEIQWLQNKYGECLAKFGRPRPPCWEQPKTGTGDGKWFKP